MKLHLGCGRRFIPGFVHLDAIDFPHVNHVRNVDDLSCFDADSCDLIYACHIVEHFTRTQVGTVLREWGRVLRPGGTLRIAVPDFEAICEVYTRTKDLRLVIGPVFGRQDHQHNFHYSAFDFDAARQLLEDCGFTDVRRYDWRETEHADVDDFSQAYIPHMDKANGTLISLNIECTKLQAADR
ncbi:methyltransferase domain-containing protein [Methylibium sp.]|uniref:class I SAM-dependent methyltransferase n=1 Tax=Methylibium sp. TaxID=2067992 RepID=UPI0018022087|nr:methyltransferase domain-containing protein [Methylibium sp.]MBA3588105.1 methyltransferase domain-containing protein [Methylibium sp.]